MKKTVVIAVGMAMFLMNATAKDDAGSETKDSSAGKQKTEFKHTPPPIIVALDKNKDGVIDAEEIANASAALKTLDKNGDGKLTMDELHPAKGEGKGEARGEGKGKGKHGKSADEGQTPPADKEKK